MIDWLNYLFVLFSPTNFQYSTIVGKSETKATSVTMQGVDTNPMNATSVTSIFSNMRFEGSFENTIVEKSWTNATSVTMHLPKQAVWGIIWKHTVEKSRTNATSVIMHLLKEAIWGLSWTHTVEKSLPIAIRVTLHLLKQAISVYTHLKTHNGQKSNECNQCEDASSQTGNFRTN